VTLTATATATVTRTATATATVTRTATATATTTATPTVTATTTATVTVTKTATPTVTATATATTTATMVPTITPPPPTVTATATLLPTATQTATATPIGGSISFVGSTASTTTTVVVPNGVQNGDLLLASFSYWMNSTPNAPTGWQLLHSVASASVEEAVWYRFANNDTPGASYTWRFGGSSPYESAAMVAYRGVDPSVQDGFCTSQGSSTTPALCSFTTNSSNDQYVGFISAGSTNLAMPADLNSRALVPFVASTRFGDGVADKALGAPGTVAVDVASMGNGTWAAVALALKPSNGSPTPTATATATTTATTTATATATATAIATVTATATPSTPSATATVSKTPTVVPTVIPPTTTATATIGSTVTATLTATPTPVPPPANITYIGSTSTTTGQVTVPAGVQNGDLLLVSFSYWMNSTPNAPAGWQLLHSVASATVAEAVWYRFASNDTPGSSYTWLFGGSKPYESGAMLAYRGVDPSVQDGFCTSEGSSTKPSFCSFTTQFSNDQYVGFISGGNTGLTIPSDLTSRAMVTYVASTRFADAAADKALGAPGTIAADSAMMTNGTWATVAVALKPAASNPTPTATATKAATATPTVAPTSVPTIVPPTTTATATAVNPTTIATPTATATPIGVTANITYVGSTTTTSTQMTVPAGVQDGDLMLAAYSYWTNSTPTAPAGWQLLQRAASTTAAEAVWYRFANNDTPGSTYTWTFNGGAPQESGTMLAYGGIDPAVEDGFCTSQATSIKPTLCAFTTNFSNDQYVGFISAGSTSLVLPHDLTSRGLVSFSSGAHFGAGAADKTLGLAGSVAADSATMSNGTWASIALALKPAGSTGATGSKVSANHIIATKVRN